ncbi:hypothetical protein KGP16_27320 (plasmid) [Serratia sp. JSRIV006]|nr:hypothetical protein KGP16_27320 [Serratia sp. JSRIV006]
MRPQDLDRVLEMWARWVWRGYSGGGFCSMIDMMMTTGCVFNGGGRGPALWSVEAEVEAAVMALAAVNGSAARVLRYEYGAWALRGLDEKAKQIDKAHALFMSLSTYKRHLAKGRAFVFDWMIKKRVQAR